MALVPVVAASAAAAAAAAAEAEAGALVESDLGGVSAESLAGILHAQRELFHGQVEELQRVVVAQCKLTGVNPLAQEMAAGALSIKIGKKPRDLLNPKAVKYMQSIFSIKDTIGKKETREISALCGVTVTQVRDFFTSQRSRVRKLVRLSHEKATILEASHQSSSNVCFSSSDQPPPISIEPPLQTAEPQKAQEPSVIPTNSANINAADKEVQQSTEHAVNVKAVVGSTKQGTVPGEAFPGVDSEDKTFLDSIFSLMRKEETFSGQVKLMEWILHINNIAVLHWFLTRGGLTILATWLSQAAVEEQTTVLDVIFKVLCHLPLHKALPVDMSAILQTVNRLRFYRSSDISNRAKILLKRWSKLLLRSQALKKPPSNSLKEAQKAMICKQRFGEILKAESWQNDIEIPGDILALTANAENSSVTEPRKALKLLTASSDESTKKHALTVSSSKTKERRKVLLVEHPERKTAGRNAQAAKVVSTSSSRPLSADDIQKAKMRAMYMQNKYGKANASKSENDPPKIENPKISLTSPNARTIMPGSRISQLHHLKKSVEKSPLATTARPPHKTEIPVKQKPISTSREHLMEMLKRNQICWKTPPEVGIDPAWRVGAGENSKELQVQTQRNRREKETRYSNLQDIPPNPKEPWDTEMDFDDSLTLEIPTEQPPDADVMEEDPILPPPPSNIPFPTEASPPAPAPSVTPSASGEGAGPPGPDLELLAVLLKNPELVFALTSGQGKSLPSEQTVALLDLLKKSGVGLAELVKGSVNGSEEKPKEPQPVPVPVPAPALVPMPQPKPEPKPEPIPTSLPSPTPPSDPAERINWRSEFPTLTRTPALQPHLPGIRGGTAIPNTSRPPPRARSPVVAPPLVDNFNNAQTILSMPPPPGTINPSQQHLLAYNILPNRQQDPAPHQNPAFTGDVLSSRRQSVSNMPTVSGRSLSPSLNTTRSMPQPEPTAFPSTVPSRQSTANMSSAWRGQQSNLSDVPGPNPHFSLSQNGYSNPYQNGAMPAHRVAFPGRDEPVLDSWSPHGSPRSEFRAGWNPTEQRMNNGRSYRPESSRQWNPGNRDQYRSGGGSSRRWRDRDRRR